MIRPASLLCFLVAVAAGAWLYQVKHEAQLMDREIRRIQRQADQARDRISILRAEWALLNLPDRLREVAGRHLALVRVEPTQYASVTDFSRRAGSVAVAPVQVADTAVSVQEAPPVVPVSAPARENAANSSSETRVRLAPAVVTDEPARVEAVPVRVTSVSSRTLAVPTASVRRAAVNVPSAGRSAPVPEARPSGARSASSGVQAVATAPVRTESPVVTQPAVARVEPVSASASISSLGGVRSALAPPVPVGAR